MTKDDTAEVIASAVRFVDNRTDKAFFAKEEVHCGALLARSAMINIVAWLAYVGRGGKESAFLKIQGSGPLKAIACALESGGKLSELFHLTENKLHWNDAISSDSRVAAATYVAKNHKPVMHVSYAIDGKDKSGG